VHHKTLILEKWPGAWSCLSSFLIPPEEFNQAVRGGTVGQKPG
jgi:hypothetical protein